MSWARVVLWIAVAAAPAWAGEPAPAVRETGGLLGLRPARVRVAPRAVVEVSFDAARLMNSAFAKARAERNRGGCRLRRFACD